MTAVCAPAVRAAPRAALVARRRSLVRDADHESACRRRERQLEGLLAREPRAIETGRRRPPRAGSRPRPWRRVPTSRSRSRRPARRPRARPGSPPRGRRPDRRPASRSTVRFATAGSAAIMSVMWYGGAGTPARRRSGLPWIAGSRQRRAGIEGRLGGHLGSFGRWRGYGPDPRDGAPTRGARRACRDRLPAEPSPLTACGRAGRWQRMTE